eukprot:jgi/Chlat1/8235/Chrsp77S07669
MILKLFQVTVRSGLTMQSAPPLFDSITIGKVAMGASVFAAAGLSNAGGVGGGILYVPLYLLLLNFTVPEASANAQPLILGGVLASVGYHLRRTHPLRKHAPRINWELASVFLPSFLAGTTPGVFLSQAMPNFVTSWLLALVLALLFLQSVIVGSRMCQRQLTARRHKLQGTPDASAEFRQKMLDGALQASLLAESGQERDAPASADAVNYVSDEDAEPQHVAGFAPWPGLLKYVDPAQGIVTLRHVVDIERQFFPPLPIVLLLTSWATIFVFSYVRGSARRAGIAGIQACSTPFWLLIAVQEVLLFGLCGLSIARAARFSRLKYALGYLRYDLVITEYRDVQWEGTDLLLYPLYTFLVGAMAAFLGLGGATLLLPLLLNYSKLDPVVVSSTTAVLNSLGAASSTFQFFITGALLPDYALVYGACTFLGSFFGVYAVMYIVNKYELKALIVLILSAVFLIALTLVVNIAADEAKAAIRAHEGIIIRSICH